MSLSIKKNSVSRPSQGRRHRREGSRASRPYENMGAADVKEKSLPRLRRRRRRPAPRPRPSSRRGHYPRRSQAVTLGRQPPDRPQAGHRQGRRRPITELARISTGRSTTPRRDSPGFATVSCEGRHPIGNTLPTPWTKCGKDGTITVKKPVIETTLATSFGACSSTRLPLPYFAT